MSTLFTPGPWSVHAVHHGSGAPYSPIVATTLIAKVYSTAYGDEAQSQANARLMAAAPLLLEACRTFVEWLRREENGSGIDRDNSGGEENWREWFDCNMQICALAQTRAMVAIAKAIGDIDGDELEYVLAADAYAVVEAAKRLIAVRDASTRPAEIAEAWNELKACVRDFDAKTGADK